MQATECVLCVRNCFRMINRMGYLTVDWSGSSSDSEHELSLGSDNLSLCYILSYMKKKKICKKNKSLCLLPDVLEKSSTLWASHPQEIPAPTALNVCRHHTAHYCSCICPPSKSDHHKAMVQSYDLELGSCVLKLLNHHSKQGKEKNSTGTISVTKSDHRPITFYQPAQSSFNICGSCKSTIILQ